MLSPYRLAAGKSTQNMVIGLVSSPGMRSSRGLKILNRGRNPHNNLLSETFREQRGGNFKGQNPQILNQNSFGVATFCKRRRTIINRYAANTGDNSALSSQKYSEKVENVHNFRVFRISLFFAGKHSSTLSILCEIIL